MTKYRKKVLKHVEVKEGYEETRTVCDLCKRNVDDVSDSPYDMTRIKIDAKIGSVYPDGDCRDGYRLDCCAECFEGKVKPAIEALGTQWHEYDVEDSYHPYSSAKVGNDYWELEPHPASGGGEEL